MMPYWTPGHELKGLSRVTVAAIRTWEKIVDKERYLERRTQELEKFTPLIPEEEMERYVELTNRIIGVS